MKGLLATSLSLLVALTLTVALRAEDKKEVTLKGQVMCAHCELKEGSKCQTVVRVKEGDQEVTYYFKDKGHNESYHEEVCGGERREGTVTGTVTREGEKRFITPKKVAYAKK